MLRRESSPLQKGLQMQIMIMIREYDWEAGNLSLRTWSPTSSPSRAACKVTGTALGSQAPPHLPNRPSPANKPSSPAVDRALRLPPSSERLVELHIARQLGVPRGRQAQFGAEIILFGDQNLEKRSDAALEADHGQIRGRFIGIGLFL